MRQRPGFDEVMIVNPHDPARDPRERMFLGIDSLAGAASLGDYAEPAAMAYYSEYPGAGAGYLGEPIDLGWYGMPAYGGLAGYGELEPVGYYAADPLAGYAEDPYGAFAEDPYSGYGGYGQYPFGEWPFGGYAQGPLGWYAEEPFGAYDYGEDPYGEDPYGEDPYGGYGEEPYGGYGEEPLASYAEDPFGGWGEPEYGEPELGPQYGVTPEMVGYGEDPLGDGMGGYVRDVPSSFNAGCPLPTNVSGFGEPPLEGYMAPRQVSPSVTAFTAADTPISTPETFRPLW